MKYIGFFSLLCLINYAGIRPNNHLQGRSPAECFAKFKKRAKQPQCSIIPPCTSQDYWESLTQRLGQEELEQKISNFLNNHVPWIFELLTKDEEGSLWEEIVKLAPIDPLVKAIVEDNYEELEWLLSSIQAEPISDNNLNKKCEITSLNLSIDYLSIAFMVAFINTATPDRYHIFRRLLSAGANPHTTLILGQNSLPLLVLALLLNSPEALDELLEHKAAWPEDHRLADILRAYEDEFECRSPADLVPFGDRYQVICVE